MLNRVLHIVFLSILASAVWAQEPTKKVEIVSKSGKKLNFSDVQIESDAKESYKTLEIRYVKMDNPTSPEITIDGVAYKSFKDKKSAVSYYYVVKKASPEVVVYYVHSLEAKKPEVFTFRVTSDE